ncbi:hypothetical protein [Vibrio aestuarianus]|uniref:hypothetical protein n=1 Tax=Vibrio aestuarianus TaxID=28171 RepID=UPI00237D27D0|nr:hypothetical protein [Vibrio aestuarianus]MDE1265402.1 hypothetical protein [Vibrio aestuarianus]MDE1297555.1 hypothetical protein [Vibrio aestuarianus]
MKCYKALFWCLLVVSNIAMAEVTSTSINTIDRLYAYDNYGSQDRFEGADVAVWFKTGLTECPHGVWLTPSAPGYQTLVSFLLMAYTTKQTVRFQVYNDRIWKGSKSKLCQIDAVRFE